MNIEPENQGHLASSDSSQNNSNTLERNSKAGSFFEQIHSVNSLYFIAALLEVVLGVTVITASVLGMIRPLWISTMMSMFASITCMVGLYFFYCLTFRIHDENHLIREAMRRIMNAQN